MVCFVGLPCLGCVQGVRASLSARLHAHAISLARNLACSLSHMFCALGTDRRVSRACPKTITTQVDVFVRASVHACKHARTHASHVLTGWDGTCAAFLTRRKIGEGQDREGLQPFENQPP